MSAANTTSVPPVLVDALADVNKQVIDLGRKLDGLTGAIMFTGGLLVGLYVLRGMKR